MFLTGAAAAAPADCTPFVVTVYGSYGTDPESATGAPAWVGRALFKFGDGALQQATFVDRNNSLKPPASPGAPFSGTETITFRLGDDAFDIVTPFEGEPGFAPGFYTLHEKGKVANGKGAFDGASGEFDLHGPFVFPSFEGASWLAQARGTMCGTTR